MDESGQKDSGQTDSAQDVHLSKEERKKPTNDLPEDVWKRLRGVDRGKLRAAYTLAITAKAVTGDLKIFLLNLAFLAIALIPGPGAVFIIPFLLASYAIRPDKRARQIRSEFVDLFKNGVPIERYQDFIEEMPADKAGREGVYTVRGKELIKAKAVMIKDHTVDVHMTGLKNLKKTYNALVYQPVAFTLNNIYHRCIKLFAGQESADKAAKDALDGYHSVEKTVNEKASYIAGKVEKAGDNASSWVKGKLGLVFGWKAGSAEDEEPVKKFVFVDAEEDEDDKIEENAAIVDRSDVSPPSNPSSPRPG